MSTRYGAPSEGKLTTAAPRGVADKKDGMIRSLRSAHTGRVSLNRDNSIFVQPNWLDYYFCVAVTLTGPL